MTRTRIAAALAAALFVLATHSLGADVRADQKTRIEFGGMLGRMVNFFGGKAAKEGVTSTVAVKGDRKATTTGQTGQIVDLAEEKIYDLDLRRKTYKVTTFAELRRQMEEAQKRAEEEARRQGDASDAPASTSSSRENEKQAEIDVDIKHTDEVKVINGFNTHRAIMTITVREKGKTLEQGGGMVTTTDLWLTPTIAAMKEVASFDMRYAEKLYGGFSGASAEQMAAAMALYPLMKQAMGRMNTESSKLEGTAILTTITMEAVKSEAQMAEEARAAEESKPAGGGLGGLLGGLAKKAAAKKGDSGARTTFLTSTNEVLRVATDVSAADLAIPAGFKENK